MTSKSTYKTEAIKLRKQGKTYSEILTQVPVAKSTLSLWLNSVGLSKRQKQKLSAKKIASQKRGAARVHEIRIEETKKIFRKSLLDIGRLSKREMFLLGVTMYWAEGSKIKNNKTGVMVDFANSDPAMITFFVKWLLLFCNVKKDDICLRLHLHKNHKENEDEFIEYWSDVSGLSKKHFTKTNFKKHNPKTKRKNIGDSYKGLVAVRVKKSTKLNRRIQGWIYGIIASQN